LLSISIRELQKLVNICNVELNDCFLVVNNMKSAYIRIGPRFKILSCNITMNGVKLVWKNEIRYLGILIITGYKFKINMQQAKQKFFRAQTVYWEKLYQPKIQVSPSLVLNSFCSPIIFYGLEALFLNKGIRDPLEFVYKSLFVLMLKIKGQFQFVNDTWVLYSFLYN